MCDSRARIIRNIRSLKLSFFAIKMKQRSVLLYKKKEGGREIRGTVETVATECHFPAYIHHLRLVCNFAEYIDFARMLQGCKAKIVFILIFAKRMTRINIGNLN